ncbi:histidine phosphatase family protein [Jeotgalibaca sp. MA1X17-3]|uniref:SixA phosphatase family protein n=1 Tax=Jeotgalibaca sp. MA1X17-3 TaxID=2908211 RepID=UPI001F196141|nr:histidine phosphatase family protein [Jeotgalibaca sp. MA1X17-3]UJF15366.1 histidine phosphatase family protein [Jeotgalibaca sp. MA1X17-3]
MLGELILIRHGDAEKRTTDKPDSERRLTDKGKEEFKVFTKTLYPFLKEKSHLKIWTSPLIRAKETAEILMNTLDCSEIEEKRFLASGNFEEFLKQLQAEKDDFTLICIGHEPYTGFWTKELTGINVNFEKGTAARIIFDDSEDGLGKLDWKLTPKSK